MNLRSLDGLTLTHCCMTSCWKVLPSTCVWSRSILEPSLDVLGCLGQLKRSEYSFWNNPSMTRIISVTPYLQPCLNIFCFLLNSRYNESVAKNWRPYSGCLFNVIIREKDIQSILKGVNKSLWEKFLSWNFHSLVFNDPCPEVIHTVIPKFLGIVHRLESFSPERRTPRFYMVRQETECSYSPSSEQWCCQPGEKTKLSSYWRVAGRHLIWYQGPVGLLGSVKKFLLPFQGSELNV